MARRNPPSAGAGGGLRAIARRDPERKRRSGWGGWGGSLVIADLDARMTVSYTMNQMLEPGGTGDDRAFGIVVAAYEGLW